MDRFNVEEVRSQATKLNQQLQRFTEDCSTASKLVVDLNQHFDDPVYDKFAAKFKSYQPTMTSLQEALDAYIKFMNGSSDAYADFMSRAAGKIG